MGALQYAGASSTEDTDVATKRTVDTAIKNTAPNQTSVQASIQTAVQNRATKTYVDTQDSRFAPASEFQTKDAARNVPKNTVNAPSGPASLPIAATRFAALGAGYVMGPYGWQTIDAPSTSSAAVRIATLNTDAIPSGKRFWPLCFGQVLVTSGDTGGLPYIEIRAGGGALLATGRGRTMFTGGQGLTAMPSEGGAWITSNGGSFTVSMFLADANGRPVNARDGSAIAIGGAVYILLAS